jgi:hypothetical protein
MENDMLMLMLIGALAAAFRRPRIRLADVEPAFQTDGGCYCGF